MNCHYNNVLKTLSHDFKNHLILSGLKVNAFYNNLIIARLFHGLQEKKI